MNAVRRIAGTHVTWMAMLICTQYEYGRQLGWQHFR
jgi:hypothetical protein